ncbi:MAG: thioredoxin family protein, partial [Acidobacteriota bacterium]|nr:thioredoxin family protein [Acidobacteriota bacterium]
LGRWQGKRWAGVVAALLLLVVVLAGFYAPQKLISESTPAAQPATGLGWQPWSSEAVSQYQAQGRPVFVDFTASWCLSCQVNERIALDQPEVKHGFAQANVVLLRADWTRRDESITQALTALGRDGVPAYVLYRPGQSTPILLPQVLTSGIILDALKDLPRTSGQQPN